MQRLILAVLLLLNAAFTEVAYGEVIEHDGPYGLKALVVEKDGQKLLAWKIANDKAKLLFIGAIYDGKENLSSIYSRKLLGQSRLESQAVSAKTDPGQGGKLYIFFDPNCDTCQQLIEKFEQEPAQCLLVWVPLSLSFDQGADQPGIEWLMTAMPKAAGRIHLYDAAKYQQIAQGNYRLLKWLIGSDEPISVPTFAWVDADKQMQVKTAEQMTGGRLDQVIGFLKGVIR